MLFLCAAFFLLLALHPFVTYPASLYMARRLRGRRSHPSRDAILPRFSVCVPAYNEEASIVAKAENLLALKRSVSSCEVLIYIDAATDRTMELLQPYADQFDIVSGTTRRGKSYGLNLLTARASGDVLVFTDANVILDENALVELGQAFADPEVGCVCGHLKYGNANESATAASGSIYQRLEEGIRQLECDTVGIVGADGSLFATRRHLHPVVPPDIIDDFYVSMKILLAGYAVVRAPKALAFERTGSDAGEEFRRKVRIACQAFNVHRLLWRDIRRARAGVIYAYVSHRLLKWLIAYNLVVAAVFALAAVVQVFTPKLLGLVAVVLGAAVAATWRLKVVAQIRSVLVAFIAVAWGVYRSIRGDRFQTWELLASARHRADLPG